MVAEIKALGGTSMKKRIFHIGMILLVGIYLVVQLLIEGAKLSELVSTALAILSVIAFLWEFWSNERVNEAQLIMELNNQFATNPQFSNVELELERYYDRYLEAQRLGKSIEAIPFGIDLDKYDDKRQSMINYLVHLEGIVALVSEGVLHLDAITDLMAYRYFIAVNNPDVQKKELRPYQKYYRGCFRIYEEWSKIMGEDNIPMTDHALVKTKKQNKKWRIRR